MSNRAVYTVADYTPITIVGPRNERLPGGGGEVITLYNLKPAKLGAVDNFVTYSAINKNRYHGYEVNLNGRLKNGGLVFCGITRGRRGSKPWAGWHPEGPRRCTPVPP